jgi:hypothetical protein
MCPGVRGKPDNPDFAKALREAAEGLEKKTPGGYSHGWYFTNPRRSSSYPANIVRMIET